MNWHDCPQLLPGDVVCVKGKKSKISFLIRVMSTLRGEPPTVANHVAMMMDDHVLVEAIHPCVTERLLLYHYGQWPERYEVALFRRNDWTAMLGAKLRWAAQHYLGKRYSIGKLVCHAVDWFLTQAWWLFGGHGEAYLARRLTGDRYPICSWLVAWIYERAGRGFITPPAKAQPDDIWDECMSDPAWRVVFFTDGLAGVIGDRLHGSPHD